EMVPKSLYTGRTIFFDVTWLSRQGRVEGAVVSLRADLGDSHLIGVKNSGRPDRIGRSIEPIDIVRIKDQGKWTAVECGNAVDVVRAAIETNNVQDDASLVEYEHVALCRRERQIVRKH